MRIPKEAGSVFLYQQNHRYVAQTADELEAEGADELRELGAHVIRSVYRAVYFEADKTTLYRINYQSRLITRVLAPLAAFTCHESDQLYRQARLIPWKELMGADQTFAVFANLSNSRIRHSQYAGLCVKDAVADYFREDCGRRPDVRRIDPDVWISLFIENNQAVISLDTSGGSLHRRGYRRETVEAPMQETVAAAIIRLSAWDGERPLVDPMCGSGTLLIEALMHWCRLPAAFLRRRFGFEQLPDFDRRLWQAVKAEAEARTRALPEGLISGSDLSPDAVAAARANSRLLPQGEHIALTRADFRNLTGLGGGVIVCNPPYGIRLGRRSGMGAFYAQIGDFLKQRCRGSEAYIYFGEREMIKHLGLKPSWRRPLKNGGLDGRLVKYELY
jgi:putative N6-adenine-specific DNA methylase